MNSMKLRISLPFLVCMAVVPATLLAADDQVRIVPAEELAQWWQEDPASPNPAPAYYDNAARVTAWGCMAVAFLIHPDGHVSNERVWRDTVKEFSWRKDMEQSVLRTVHQWRFIPASGNQARSPVYSYMAITFTFSHEPWVARQTREKCRMPDFAQQVQAATNSTQQGQKP